MRNATNRSPVKRLELFNLTGLVSDYNRDVLFFLVLSGSAELVSGVNRQSLSSQSVAMAEYEMPYRLMAHDAALILAVHLDQLFVEEQLMLEPSMYRLAFSDQAGRDCSVVRGCLAALAEAWLRTSGQSDLLIQALLFDLLHTLKSVADSQSANRISDETPTRVMAKLHELSNFLTQRCASKPTLSEAAATLDYTPEYLAAFVKKNTGKTFQNLLNAQRCELAYALLRQTDLPITKVASSCGFTSVAAMERTFASEIGQTPNEYRRVSLAKAATVSPFAEGKINVSPLRLALDYLKPFLEERQFGTIFSEPVRKISAVVKAGSFVQMHKPWSELLNLGDAEDFDRPGFRRSIKLIQSDLHFRFGRILNILRLAEEYRTESAHYFNFNRVFQIIDFLLEISIKPMFELGDKPFLIYRQPESDLPSDYFAHSSVNDSFLERILPQFVAACIHRYGFDEVSSWQFELWLRYTPLMRAVESTTQYSRRFAFVARTIKSLVPAARLGGPGFNSSLSPDILESVLKDLGSSGCHPDFISFCLFPYEIVGPDLPPPIISGDPGVFRSRLKAFRQIMNATGYENCRLYVTEFGSLITPTNHVNDSSFHAVNVIKQCLDCASNCDAMGYWMAHDLSMVYNSPQMLLFGGNGLVSRDGIKKPVHYAFEFLEALGSRLLGKGSHYIITASPSGNFAILMFHHVRFSKEFCYSRENFTYQDFPAIAFNESAPVDVTVQLDNIVPGKYFIRRRVLDMTHGNLLSVWLGLGSPRQLNRRDTDWLKNACIPQLSIERPTTGDVLNISARLGRGEAVLFEISLQL